MERPHERFEENYSTTASGSKFTVTISEDNSVWIFGTNKLIATTHPLKIPEQEFYIPRQICGLEKIIQVSCGSSHASFLSTHGFVFSIPFLHRLNIPEMIYISSGGFFDFYISTNHKVWQRSGTTKDSEVKPLEDIPHVKTISCGNSHALLLTKDNKLYGYGSNQYGVLGNNSTIDYTENFVKLKAPKSKIKQISSGRFHSAILTKSGDVYYTGGITTTKKQFSLLKNIPKIGRISCCSNHIFCIGLNPDNCLYHVLFSNTNQISITNYTAPSSIVSMSEGFIAEHCIITTDQNLSYSVGNNSDQQCGVIDKALITELKQPDIINYSKYISIKHNYDNLAINKMNENRLFYVSISL